jgi:hypothetical protein
MSNLTDHYFEDDPEDESDSGKLGLASVLLLLLLIAAMLTTLLWPVLWQTLYRLNAPPTSTPIFMQEV